MSLEVNQKLEDLPASTDKFWQDAEVEVVRPPAHTKCEHNFVRMNGIEAECTNCHAGYFLDATDLVKEGHIYHDGVLVI